MYGNSVLVWKTFLTHTSYIQNNIHLTAALLKWKAGAWDIQGLPLWPASP